MIAVALGSLVVGLLLGWFLVGFLWSACMGNPIWRRAAVGGFVRGLGYSGTKWLRVTAENGSVVIVPLEQVAAAIEQGVSTCD